MLSQTKKNVFLLFSTVIQRTTINPILFVVFNIIESIQLLSYTFSSPISKLNPLQSSLNENLRKITGAFRISPLFTLLSFDYYLIIWAFVAFITFLFIFSGLVALTINNRNNCFYKFYTVILAQYSLFSSVIVIPFIETLLTMLRCDDNNKMNYVKDGITCFKGMHLLYTTLSALMVLGNLFVYIVSELFTYSPLNNHNRSSPQKINNTNSLLGIIFKCILITLQIIDKYPELMLVFIILAAGILSANTLNNPTFNNQMFQTFSVIRDLVAIWNYIFVLIIRIFAKDKQETFIFLIVGYPIAGVAGYYLSLFSREKRLYSLVSEETDSGYLKNINSIIELFEDAQKMKTTSKSVIYLEGYTELHLQKCLDSDCSLVQYMKSQDSLVKKNSMMKYINSIFIEGFKKYPYSIMLMLTYIHYNYIHEYQNNTNKIILSKLSHSDMTFTEEFFFFCLNDKIESESTKTSKENETLILEFKFNRMKNLIEDTTKLYLDFLGNLSTNLISNLNIEKIFHIGKKITSAITEINELWEKSLKSRLYVNSTQSSVVHLYSLFLRKVLCNKRLSEEVSHKLSNEIVPITKEGEINLEHIDESLENEKYIAICRSNEKGECDLINISNSCINLLGYQKHEVMGKKIEVLMSPLFTEDDGHMKMMAKRLRRNSSSIEPMGTSSTPNKGNEKMKKQNRFSYPRAKNGYIIPCSVSFNVYIENDFSNSFLIKAKLEPKEPKNSYAFYILVKEDFTLEALTSSCIHLGVSNELIKKYVVDMNNLVLNDKKERLNLSEDWKNYVDESKEVYWVFPDMLYPNEDEYNNSKFEAKDLSNLISISRKKLLKLLIIPIQYSPETIIGYSFRFEVPNQTRFCHNDTSSINNIKYNKAFEFIYDMRELRIERAFLAKKDNVRTHTNLLDVKTISLSNPNDSLVQNVSASKSPKSNSDDSSEENRDNTVINSNTLKRISVYNIEELENFIKRMYFYGKDVTIGKFRPNKELYFTDKTTEPLIRISISHFKHRIEAKINHLQKAQKKTSSNLLGSQDSENNQKDSALDVKETKENDSESENQVDENLIISSLINQNTQKKIFIFVLCFFSVNIALIIIEFIWTLEKISSSSSSYYLADTAYRATSSILYVHYFITEVILAQDPDYPQKNMTTNKEYIIDMMKELRGYRDSIQTNYHQLRDSNFENEVLLFIISNNDYKNETFTFRNAMERLVSNIFYVSTISDNYFQISLANRNAYEITVNCLNAYLKTWMTIQENLFNEVFKKQKNERFAKLLYMLTVVVQIGSWFIGCKFLDDFVNERKKPISLLLTVKREKYEKLKQRSELFLNSILNKQQGNDEIEHDQQSEGSVEISGNDIIASKIKAEFKAGDKGVKESFILIIHIEFAIFMALIEIYFLIKYIAYSSMCSRLTKIVTIANITTSNEIDMVFTGQAIKSYYLSSQIPILEEESEKIYNSLEAKMTDSLGEFLSYVYQACENIPEYRNLFHSIMAFDFLQYVTGTLSNNNNLISFISLGYKITLSKYFENIRFFYLYGSSIGESKNKILYSSKTMTINEIIRNIIRPISLLLKEKINNEYDNYIDKIKLLSYSCLIILGILILCAYLFLWRHHEAKLNDSFQSSVGLLNIIPNEMKRQIVLSVFEEEKDK